MKELAHQEPTLQGGYDGYGDWVVDVEDAAEAVDKAVAEARLATLTEAATLRSENERLTDRIAAFEHCFRSADWDGLSASGRSVHDVLQELGDLINPEEPTDA